MVLRVGRHRNLPFTRARSKAAFNFEDFIAKGDYVGALAILEFEQEGTLDQSSQVDKLLWIGYCAFRLKDYSKSKDVYLELLSGKYGDVASEAGLFLACCYFYLRMYDEAEEAAMSVNGDLELKNRILLHVACKTNDETKVVKYRQNLHDSKEDRLSAAAIEFSFRHRYQEPVNVYRQILVDHGDDLALKVYIAQCYFKMAHYNLSLEVLSIYAQANPESTITSNLKACNMFNLSGGKAALEVLDCHVDEKTKENEDIIRHNIAVFNEGEKALQVFPPLMDHIPEAKLNLALYYMRIDELAAAVELLEDFKPDSLQAHRVLATLYTLVAQSSFGEGSNALLQAQKHFQFVGDSERDTLPGRLSMSSFLFLSNEFVGATEHLESVKSILSDDDDFNWNYGISLAASGEYEEGLKTLLKLSNDSYKSELAYLLWLSKCYVKLDSPEKAWACYMKSENGDDAFNILHLIANECYKMGEGQFLYSARAFEELIKLGDSTEFMKGMIGACVGYFRYLLAKRQKTGRSKWSETESGNLMELLDTLESFKSKRCESVAQTIRSWTAQNHAVITEYEMRGGGNS